MSEDLTPKKPGLSEHPPECSAKKLPGLMPVGIIFSLAAILLLTIGTRVQQRSLLIGLLITEFILIALPPLLFSLYQKYPLTHIFRIRRIKPLNILIIVLCSLFAYPVASGLSLLSLVLIKVTLGNVTALNLPFPDTGTGLIVYLLAIAVSAALCEELLFRGFIQTGLRRFGVLPSILLTAFLFGLFHVDLTRFAGTFFLGLLLSFYVYRTGSIFAGMTAHFTNNAIAVCFGFLSKKLTSGIQPSGLYTKPLESTGTMEMVVLVITAIVIVVFFGAMVAALLFAFYKSTADSQKCESVPLPQNKIGFLWFLPGLCVIFFHLTAQALVYSGIKVQWMIDLLSITSGG